MNGLPSSCQYFLSYFLVWDMFTWHFYMHFQVLFPGISTLTNYSWFCSVKEFPSSKVHSLRSHSLLSRGSVFIIISLTAWDTAENNNYIGASGTIGVISGRLGHKAPLVTKIILVYFLKTFTILGGRIAR